MDPNLLSGLTVPSMVAEPTSNDMDASGAKPPDMEAILDFLRKNGLKVFALITYT